MIPINKFYRLNPLNNPRPIAELAIKVIENALKGLSIAEQKIILQKFLDDLPKNTK